MGQSGDINVMGLALLEKTQNERWRDDVVLSQSISSFNFLFAVRISQIRRESRYAIPFRPPLSIPSTCVVEILLLFLPDHSRLIRNNSIPQDPRVSPSASGGRVAFPHRLHPRRYLLRRGRHQEEASPQAQMDEGVDPRRREVRPDQEEAQRP